MESNVYVSYEMFCECVRYGVFLYCWGLVVSRISENLALYAIVVFDCGDLVDHISDNEVKLGGGKSPGHGFGRSFRLQS